MNIFSFLHYLSLLSIVVPPFYFINLKPLLLYAIYATLVILHWKFLDGKCWLTILERKFYPQEYYQSDHGFISTKLQKYGFNKLGKNKYLTDIGLLFLLLISLIRIYIIVHILHLS